MLLYATAGVFLTLLFLSAPSVHCTLQHGSYKAQYFLKIQIRYNRETIDRDARLSLFEKKWLERERLPGCGSCNAGNLTFKIARELNPRAIMGIDKNKYFIKAGRDAVKNIAANVKMDIMADLKLQGPNPNSKVKPFPFNVFFRQATDESFKFCA
jgi:hypothetical protein